MDDTKKLIHEMFSLWDEENEAVEMTDEEVFAAGANAIINYLINTGKL